MKTLSLGVAILALFTLAGLGPSLACLDARRARLAPLFAPLIGFALVAVGAEIPSWFLPAPAYAWVLFVGVTVPSVVLSHRHRHRVRREDVWRFALPYGVLLIALWPYLHLPVATTLSEHNHDWVYYLNLETALGSAGYRDGWVSTGDLFADMSAVLRRGGWRAGISLVGSVLGVLLRAAPHELGGAHWGALFAILPGVTLGAFELLIPRSSSRAKAFVLATTAFSGPALIVLRMSFASHLASMPLFVAFYALAFRGLREASHGPRLLAALVLAAGITVLADATPYLALLGALVAFGASSSIALGTIARRAAWSMLALLVLPFSLYRIVLSIRSLQVTGYHAPAAHFDADLAAILPTLLSHHTHELDYTTAHPVFALAVAVACTVGLGVLVSLARTGCRTTRIALASPLVAGFLVILGSNFVGAEYPAWKVALTTSPFVTLALARGLDGLGGVPALRTAVLLLSVEALTFARSRIVAPEPIGVLPESIALARRLERVPGDIHLVGHHGEPGGIGFEHALAYLLANQGRRLHAIPHPASYLRVSWPELDFAIREEGRVILVTPDPDRVLMRGRLLFQEGPLSVYDAEPHSVASSITWGDGFLTPEHDGFDTFRWSDRTSSFFVDLPTADSCLVGRLRKSPDALGDALTVTLRPLEPHRYAPNLSVILTHTSIPLAFDWNRVVLARAPGSPTTLHAELAFVGTRSEQRVDTRPIHFALGSVSIERGAACHAP